MNAIIDTNVIIDAITAREPFKEKSQKIIRSVSKKEFNGAITASMERGCHRYQESGRFFKF
jgi:predicted nucleic acid-binding protein